MCYHLLQLFNLIDAARDHFPRLVQLLLHFLTVPMNFVEAFLIILLNYALVVRFDLVEQRSQVLHQLLLFLCVLVVDFLNCFLGIEVIIEWERLRHKKVRRFIFEIHFRLYILINSLIKILQLLFEFFKFFILLLAILNNNIHRLILDSLKEESRARFTNGYLLLCINVFVFLISVTELALTLVFDVHLWVQVMMLVELVLLFECIKLGLIKHILLIFNLAFC